MRQVNIHSRRKNSAELLEARHEKLAALERLAHLRSAAVGRVRVDCLADLVDLRVDFPVEDEPPHFCFDELRRHAE